MSRGLSTENAEESIKKVFRPVYFCRIDYPSAPIYACTAPFNITFEWQEDDPRTFLGIGEFGGVSNIEEGSELQNYGINLSLSGIPPENISSTLGEQYQGRDCRLWKGFLDRDYVLVDDPFVIFRGRIDNAEINLIERTISIVVQSRLSDWERPRVDRYNNESQQSKYPDDKGMEFVAQMVEKTIVWGVA